MSYRDLRNFTEMMRVLDYPRKISLTNFRSPNFPLVAEILVWLVKRFDADVDIPVDHTTEHDRIELIRSVAEFIALKANIKLNTKKLYQADGYAVKEALKIATLLYDAQKRSTKNGDSALQTDSRDISNVEISERLNELKSTKQLVSQLTVTGATLFDLLGREVDLREIRNSKVARQFDTAEIEEALKEATRQTKIEIDDTKKEIENVKESEQNLDIRIERRKNELERNQKRLQTLRKVRPAFMEEFEKLEVELRALYEDYLQKFRYLSYLEHLHDDAAKAEQDRLEKRQAAAKQQLELLKSEDADFESMMEGNGSIFNMNILEPPKLEKKELEKDIQDVGKGSRIDMSHRRIFGSMSGRQRIDRNDSGESLDSDTDLLIDAEDDDDDDDDDDDEIHHDDLIINGTKPPNFELKNNSEKRSVSKADNYDEDF